MPDNVPQKVSWIATMPDPKQFPDPADHRPAEPEIDPVDTGLPAQEVCRA